ncbi:hypothetical protein I4U23_025236 [Adineta vaga]|nr:hypothetical protein I4U23_025236 [Adineta vaga]
MSNNKPICKSAALRSSQVLIRKQRIERWIQKENSFSQSNRLLQMQLHQLGDQREKLIERHNYNQKLFINKQAIRFKDSEPILHTLNYVRKCCQYFDMSDIEENAIDPEKLLEDNSTNKAMRAHSSNAAKMKRNISVQGDKQSNASLTEVFLRHNKKHIQLSSAKKLSSTEQSDDNQERHVQFQMNPERNIQSAHISRKPPLSNDKDKQYNRNVTSAHGLRTYPIPPTNPIPVMTTVDHMEEQMKPIIHSRRSPARMIPTKNTLQQFRQYPEQFLSKSNRYLPLLRRQALQNQSQDVHPKKLKDKSSSSSIVDGSDLTYDDAKSFLSEEIELGKSMHNPPVISTYDNHIHTSKQKVRAPNRIDLMDTTVVDTSEQRKLALSRHRDREYTQLQKQIHSNSIEHILEPLSITKENRSRCLKDILHSIDSLRCSTTYQNQKRRQNDIEKNLSKLGILIF